eukprot:TRINITY_DN7106_c0_g1_i1.p1 TRINITY_DN7106_c0_g1~~TRINITY_DN7106_c0_g1_i1.p1  ORF type:complete len:403 (+),score=48.57 TRINITY_DN7106_c0_g1_i1:35-1243(+)
MGPPVILDIGTVNTRVGFGGRTAPECIFPTLVGEVNKQMVTPMVGQGEAKDYYIGKEVLDKRSLLKVRYPVEGAPKNFEDYEKIARHALREVGDSGKRLAIMEPTQSTKEMREKLVEFAMEDLGCEELWLMNSIPCSLFAAGRTTGVVLECSESASYVVPMLEGHTLSRSKWYRSDLSGMSVTNYMLKLLKENARLNRDIPPHLARLIKEKYTYTSTNVVDDDHVASTSPESLLRVYELPDGGSLEMYDERYRCLEYLFHPSIWTLSDKIPAVHKSVVKTITSCDERLQPKLFQNILACGGVSLSVGFKQRLQKEISTWLNGSGEGIQCKTKLKLNSTLKIIEPTSTEADQTVCTMAWRGASTLSKFSAYESMKITATDIKENGPGIAHRYVMVPPDKKVYY